MVFVHSCCTGQVPGCSGSVARVSRQCRGAGLQELLGGEEIQLVPSMAGGLAEKCCMEHCNLELYACCPHCLARLCHGCFGSAPCHTHNPGFPCECRMCMPSFEADSPQLTPQPQTPSGVEPRRRLRQKTKPQDCSPAYAIESPPSSKKGGWRKCEHPGCDQPLQTLLSLTGNKSGVAHVVQKDKRVCTLCQKRPWHQNLQIVPAEPVSVVGPSDSSTTHYQY